MFIIDFMCWFNIDMSHSNKIKKEIPEYDIIY